MSNRYKDTPVKDKKYFRPYMAVDGVVFALFDTDYTDEKFYSGEAHVLLVKRAAKDRPDLGYWALPGGFVQSMETSEEAIIRELDEETRFPIDEFRAAFKEDRIGMKQVKTYTEPKRDSWNFDKGVKLGEHRRTISTSFLLTVPNTMFTKALAYSDYYLKNNKVLPLDMDIFLSIITGVYSTPDPGTVAIKDDSLSGVKDPNDFQEIVKIAWRIINNETSPNKFLQKLYDIDVTEIRYKEQNEEDTGFGFLPLFAWDLGRKIPISQNFSEGELAGLGDASEAAFFSIKDVLNGDIEKGRLAFDHDDILRDAVDHFTESLAFSPIALNLCEEEFTISDIRGIYQAFWDLKYGVSDIDLGNFQNKLLKLTDIEGKKVLIPTKKRRQLDRYKYNEKGEIIKVKGGPALLYKKNKNLKNFNLAIVPPKKK